MQLFLDSNVYLSFFKRSSDDLGKLEAIAEYVHEGGIELLVPENVEIEFYRNREKVIADELKSLSGQISKAIQLPRMADRSPLNAQIIEASSARNSLIEKLSMELKDAAEANALPADQIVKRLFEAGKRIRTTEEVLARARNRTELRNPPGKTGSIGDAINWECLLESCGRSELHVVTQDLDFYSPLFDSAMRQFLTREWGDCHDQPVHIYRHLGDFLRQRLPDYALSYDKLTEYWIQKLDASEDVESAVIACQHLEERDLSYEQSQRIIASSLGEIGGFLSDARIRKFFEYMLDHYGDYERPEFHELAETLYGLLPV